MSASGTPLYLDWLGSLLERTPGALKKMGRIETALLKYDIEDLSVTKPIFISGLARSGSTILLEILNSHPQCGSYQYSDFPFLHFNFFWNTLRLLIPSNPKKIERAHKDRIMINNQSPEALDEILWMSFFNHLHDSKIANILDETTENQEFETFYRDSILKLLALRKSKRYVSKNNYNIARLPYLLKIFPDAHFIIPIRKPHDHIYSLHKQHKLLRAMQEQDPRGRRYMARHGHFEFGLDFKPVNFGHPENTQAILQDWRHEQYISAYARYWSEIYSFLHRQMTENPKLAKQCLIVRYDDLCTDPAAQIKAILDFCGLSDENVTSLWAGRISAPDYYKPDFTAAETNIIDELTQDTSRLFWP